MNQRRDNILEPGKRLFNRTSVVVNGADIFTSSRQNGGKSVAHVVFLLSDIADAITFSPIAFRDDSGA